MKSVLLIISLFWLSQASASNAYDLSVKLKVGDKIIPQMDIVVEEGKEAVVETMNGGEKFTFTVEAKKSKKFKHGIRLNFIVGQISKDGKKKIVSTPQVITLPGQEAEVTVGRHANVSDMTLTVVAAPKNN